MKTPLSLRTLLCLGLVASLLSLAGCATSSTATLSPEQEMAQADAEIKRIQNDPTLPTAAKQQRINQIKLWQKQQNGGK